jgi:hypothetical protein
MHDYGAYLLYYFLTHMIDPTAAVVRRTWENAATTGNSYKAMDDAVNQVAPSMHDYYWPMYLTTLWNKGPFDTFYATGAATGASGDGLTDSVARAGGPVAIAATGGEQITPLYSELPTGGAMYFDMNFPDRSVRSLTILNGLGYKLSSGSVYSLTNGMVTYGTDGDETYLTEDLAAADLQGATVELLLKASGQAPRPGPEILSSNLGNLPEASYCLDVQGPLDEVVVILSNADFANPNRIMKAKGLPVTVWANNVPCWKLTGTSKVTWYNAGVTKQTSAQVTLGWPSAQMVPPAYLNLQGALFPETTLTQLSAQVSWSVSGKDTAGCTYQGSGSYAAGERVGSSSVWIEQGVLSGSPTYRGFTAAGYPDEGTKISYTVTCPPPGGTTTVTEDAWGFTDVPLDADRSHIKVDASGKMSGSYKRTYSWGDWEQFEWNLAGVTK